MWAPQKLTSRHKEIMRLTLLGDSQIAIAEKLGMTQPAISQIINSPKFQRSLNALQGSIEQLLVEGIVDRELNDPVRQRLDEVSLESLEKMVELMRGAENQNVQRQSAQDLLDRAGYKPREIVEQKHSFNVDKETDKNINQALADLGVKIDGFEEEPEDEVLAELGQEDEDGILTHPDLESALRESIFAREEGFFKEHEKDE